MRASFERLHCEAGRNTRLCEYTKSGRTLRAMNAKYRWFYTGTPFVKSLLDMRGCVAPFERVEWADKADTKCDTGCNTEERAQDMQDFMAIVAYRKQREPGLSHLTDTSSAATPSRNLCRRTALL